MRTTGLLGNLDFELYALPSVVDFNYARTKEVPRELVAACDNEESAGHLGGIKARDVFHLFPLLTRRCSINICDKMASMLVPCAALVHC